MNAPSILRPILILYWYGNDIPTMWPYIRVFGWRYVYDRAYRDGMRNRVRKRRYGSSFNVNKPKIRLALTKRDGYGCKECLIYHAGETLTIDHVIPISVGGSNVITNLQLLCRPCHEKKSAEEQRANGCNPSSKSEINLSILSKIKKERKDAREESKRKALGAVQDTDPIPVWKHLLHLR